MKGSVKTGTISKPVRRTIIVVLLILIAFEVVVLKQELTSWKKDHVTRISITQNDAELSIRWNKIRTDFYRIEILEAGEPVLIEELSDTVFTFKDIKFHTEYEVCVYGQNRAGEYVRGIDTVFMTRQPQPIETGVETIEGFAGGRVDVKATASGSITYSVKDENIASVDEEGKVTLLRPGETELQIRAEESETQLPGRLTIPLTCYPEELTAPEVSLLEKRNTSMILRIKSVGFAERYELMYYNMNNEKPRILQVIESSSFSGEGTYDAELAEDAGEYTIRAIAEVNGEEMRSAEAEHVRIEPDLSNAAVYSALTNVLTIGSEDVDTIIRTGGGGGATHAQSMCSTDDGYVIAFVNRGNSTGRLEKYDKDGELIAVNSNAGDLGHANGCTYDPSTGNVYVMQTYASRKSHTIRAFDGNTLESADAIGFGTAPSGIGYDRATDQFYMTASSRIYVTDGDLNMSHTIYRKRDHNSQDAAGCNGIVMSCIWTGGTGSYIDMYRALNGDYLGSIYVPLGEIESTCVDDGHLVMLFNGGSVYRTKERISLPGQS